MNVVSGGNGRNFCNVCGEEGVWGICKRAVCDDLLFGRLVRWSEREDLHLILEGNTFFTSIIYCTFTFADAKAYTNDKDDEANDEQNEKNGEDKDRENKGNNRDAERRPRLRGELICHAIVGPAAEEDLESENSGSVHQSGGSMQHSGRSRGRVRFGVFADREEITFLEKQIRTGSEWQALFKYCQRAGASRGEEVCLEAFWPACKRRACIEIHRLKVPNSPVTEITCQTLKDTAMRHGEMRWEDGENTRRDGENTRRDRMAWLSDELCEAVTLYHLMPFMNFTTRVIWALAHRLEYTQRHSTKGDSTKGDMRQKDCWGVQTVVHSLRVQDCWGARNYLSAHVFGKAHRVPLVRNLLYLKNLPIFHSEKKRAKEILINAILNHPSLLCHIFFPPTHRDGNSTHGDGNSTRGDGIGTHGDGMFSCRQSNEGEDMTPVFAAKFSVSLEGIEVHQNHSPVTFVLPRCVTSPNETASPFMSGSPFMFGSPFMSGSPLIDTAFSLHALQPLREDASRGRVPTVLQYATILLIPVYTYM